MTEVLERIEELEQEIYDLEDDRDESRCRAFEAEYQLEQLQRDADTRSLNYTAQEIWETCEEKGFHEPVDPDILNKALRLILIVSEVAEALEAMRKGEDEKHHEEIADAIIRLLHYGACEGIDLDAEIASKMETNRGRPYKHGKKF